ncbi:type I DNA topoisomerase [Patescibacteria group bacterium]|nr:type I DNA topoisomerase [Patescibacteria group bacterium]MDE1946541.1 type I DNA topoisomerase [Patescibacteria group bacterium]MDE2010898.1 type I DNA topoisomerase [Patescibacteria group bacterium]MDE2232782.1 type I DNA topoisomerase [Patescibacteria group bacterium]
MKLLVVESPSKAKTISKYLGHDFVVRASIGHVRDLPKSNKKAVDIEGGFIPRYEIVPKKQTVIDEIRKEAVKADEVLLATDPDREGEAIAWHLKELLTKKDVARAATVEPATSVPRIERSDKMETLRRGGEKVATKTTIPASKIKRITYHEVTKEAVEDALRHPRAIDENLKEAQEARRVLDRIVGYDLSGLIWKKVRYGLSAGRVQSPALRIIMEREREIRAFKPETYWIIAGNWKTAANESLKLVCSEEPRDKSEVERIIEIARKEKWQIIDIEESEQKRSPRAPFITSTLQQAASSRLGFSPSRTMGIAQKLYEAGHITYMRTDSTTLSKQALGQIAPIIEKEYGKEYLQFRAYATKSKNAQEAHEAIRPTHFNKVSAGTNDEQKRLYRLIWQRTVASQMADAKLAKTKILANLSTVTTAEAGIKGDSPSQSFYGNNFAIPNFEAAGSRILFDGWLKADPESNGEEVTLPKCSKNESLQLISVDSEEKQTQPPSRYTEAGLIKELEKRGIGRPSTYATISKTIEDRGYVAKENRSLKPTDTGEVVSSFLEENFPAYISDSFTAEMENKLDEIAGGERTYLKTLTEFYGPFHKEVKAKEKIHKLTNLGKADPKFKCPKCGGPMEIKLGKNGKFLSCEKYPDCDGALTLDGTEFKKDEPIGVDQATGLPIFVLNGRFGPYVQLGVQNKDRKSKIKPKKASIPKGIDPMRVTIADAMKYLSIPRTLGVDPKTGLDVVASIGRFGPYVVSDGNFRSIKAPDDVYEITLARALELLAQPKAVRRVKKNPRVG